MSLGLLAAVVAGLAAAVVVFVLVLLVLRSLSRPGAASPDSGVRPVASETRQRHPAQVAGEFDATLASLDPLFLAQLRRALDDDELRERIYVEVEVQKARDRAEYEAERDYWLAQEAAR